MISISDIASRIQNMEQDLVMEPAQLKEKIIFAYCKKSLHDIKSLFDANLSPENLIASLEKLLKSNWQLINGTLLSYTALPNSEITKLFCDIALFIVQYENQSLAPTTMAAGQVKLLMPTVAVQFCRDGYPDLNYFWGKDHNQWHYVDIEKILKTHILSTEGKFLLPIKVITELDPHTPQTLYNPYHNYLEHNPGTEVLNEEERKRLKEHSEITTAVFTSFEAYTDCMNGQQHLLGQLNLLLWHLRFNSVHGIGKEKIAGEGTSTAIHNFMEIYEKFSPEKINQIPGSVKREIKLLIAHASGNKSALEEMKSEAIDSCIATRGTALLSAIRGHEVVLSEITLSEHAKESLLKERKEKFDQAIKDADHFIDQTQERDCSDKLGVNRTILSTLNIDFKITRIEDFDLISASEMVIFFDDDDKIEFAISLFNGVSDFTLFLIHNPDDKVKVFLEKFGVKIWEKLSKIDNEEEEDTDSVTAYTFIDIITLLDDKKRTLFTEALFDTHIEIYKPYGFEDLTRSISTLDRPEDMRFLTLFIDKLFAVITAPEQLGDFLGAVKDSERKRINVSIENKLRKLIITPNDVYRFNENTFFKMADFETSLQETIKLIYAKALLKNPRRKAEFIKQCRYHVYLLEWLDASQHRQILPLLKEQLSSWPLEQLLELLNHLNFEERYYIVRVLTPNLTDIIKISSGLTQLLQKVCADVLMKDPQRIVRLIENHLGNIRLFDWLNFSERTKIIKNISLDAIKHAIQYNRELPNVVPNFDVKKLALVLSYLDADGCKAVLELLKDILPDLIATKEDIAKIKSRFNHLNRAYLDHFLTCRFSFLSFDHSADKDKYLLPSAKDMIIRHARSSPMIPKTIPNPSLMAFKPIPNKDETPTFIPNQNIKPSDSDNLEQLYDEDEIAAIRAVCSVTNPSFFGHEISLDWSDSEGEGEKSEKKNESRKRKETGKENERENKRFRTIGSP